MPTVSAVVTARSGCTTTADTVNTMVPPNHRAAWILVRNQGTPSALSRSCSLGVRSSIAQRSARSAPAVPQTVPTKIATPT